MTRSTGLNGFQGVLTVCGIVLLWPCHETVGQDLAPKTPAVNAKPIESVALPPGVIAQWDLAKAVHETTPTRERISLNGLWR